MSAQQVLVIAIDVGFGITTLFAIAVAMEYRRAAAMYKERAEYFKRLAFDAVETRRLAFDAVETRAKIAGAKIAAENQQVLGKKVPDFIAAHDPDPWMRPITTDAKPYEPDPWTRTDAQPTPKD